ncbi:MAG TPA: PIN domain-containing protein [Candidatus Angelobacter sp.]|jgi:hypothetical protein|nr:PIN domain-containing protein [Candidatus Angelobacter sp.]
MNVLVDTSVWSLVFRRKPAILNALEKSIVADFSELVKEGRVRIIGLVRQELLSGVRSVAQYEKLRTDLEGFFDETVSTQDHEEAAKCANTCRAKGVAVSVTDILICQIAMSRGFSIFTTDPDFQNYAKILPIRLHVLRK